MIENEGPKIGVITVTYNSDEHLDEFIKSVNHQNYKNFFLYFVDNHSKDGTINNISKVNSNNVKIIQNQKNLGIATANNQGITSAINDGCEFILLLNNDTSFSKNLFRKLVDGIKEEDADIVAPLTHYYDNRNYIWSAGGKFDSFFQCRVKHIGFKEKNVGQYADRKRITYAPASCLLFKKSLINDIGLMDDNYFVYLDDVDFCYRATIIKKKKMIYLPEINFYHKVGAYTNKDRLKFKSDFVIEYMTRNTVYFCMKYFNLRKLAYLFIFFLKENVKIILNREYKRSINSFVLFNKSFFKGFFVNDSFQKN
jgi:GT2 family glycosyltransferase